MDGCRRRMAHWEVPSLAIAVVKDGQVVLSGFGVRQIGSGKQVDEATLFNIAFCAVVVASTPE